MDVLATRTGTKGLMPNSGPLPSPSWGSGKRPFLQRLPCVLAILLPTICEILALLLDRVAFDARLAIGQGWGCGIGPMVTTGHGHARACQEQG
jgi:hypothetical protein